MNPTFGNINRSWQRFKLQYIAAACGLAIAAGVTLAAPPWDSNSSPSASVGAGAQTQFGAAADAAEASRDAASASPAGTTSGTGLPVQSYIYLVSSQEEAYSLRNAFVAAAQEDASSSVRTVMVIDSDQAEWNFQMMQTEMAASGSDTVPSIIDLRSR